MQVGLKVLQEDGDVLKCHTSHWENKWYAETGASAAILHRGYNIGSLMKRCACPDTDCNNVNKPIGGGPGISQYQL